MSQLILKIILSFNGILNACLKQKCIELISSIFKLCIFKKYSWFLFVTALICCSAQAQNQGASQNVISTSDHTSVQANEQAIDQSVSEQARSQVRHHLTNVAPLSAVDSDSNSNSNINSNPDSTPDSKSVSKSAAAVLPVKVTAMDWLQKMHQAIQTLHYEMSFVVVHGTNADPWRWYHGVINHQEIEILTALNGPGQQIIRKGQQITYLQPRVAPYTINNSIGDSPLPEFLRTNLTEAAHFYEFHLMGKSRVAGLPARLIRITAKDNARFGYWLWLHEKSALILKVAVVNNSGEILEQIQVSNLQIMSEPNQLLMDIHASDLPDAFDLPLQSPKISLAWDFSWLPNGFRVIKTDQRKLLGRNELVDYAMLSDGVVWFSVYLHSLDNKTKVLKSHFNAGANHFVTQQIGQHEATLIGRIPPQTAIKILHGIIFKQP